MAVVGLVLFDRVRQSGEHAARARRRQKEIGMRLPPHLAPIVRQLLTESVLFLGGAAALFSGGSLGPDRRAGADVRARRRCPACRPHAGRIFGFPGGHRGRGRSALPSADIEPDLLATLSDTASFGRGMRLAPAMVRRGQVAVSEARCSRRCWWGGRPRDASIGYDTTWSRRVHPRSRSGRCGTNEAQIAGARACPVCRRRWRIACRRHLTPTVTGAGADRRAHAGEPRVPTHFDARRCGHPRPRGTKRAPPSPSSANAGALRPGQDPPADR